MDGAYRSMSSHVKVLLHYTKLQCKEEQVLLYYAWRYDTVYVVQTRIYKGVVSPPDFMPVFVRFSCFKIVIWSVPFFLFRSLLLITPL